MACFLVPLAELAVSSTVTKVVEKKEEKKEEVEGQLKLSTKLHWLNKLLAGGSALLAFEHLWHGEISPVFPFLTAATSPGGLSEVLHEMATVGVGMALLVTAIWLVMCVVADNKVRDKKQVKAGQTQ